VTNGGRAEEEEDGRRSGREEERTGYRNKNKNPTQRRGEQPLF
jgi:hypothetical protein